MITISSTDSRWIAFAAANPTLANFIRITSITTRPNENVMVIPLNLVGQFPSGSYSML